MSAPLPIHAVAGALVDGLRDGRRLVVTAPTGSGKTTQIPQILDRAGLFRGRILISQPRRLAARWLARRVADELATPLGERVGYQTRHESRVRHDTRIVFLTEGLLLRRLREPHGLHGVDAILLDEFHERSLANDLSLALVRRYQETTRPDLRLVVMSATLDAEQVAGFLSCRTLDVPVRAHPIEISYLPHTTAEPVWDLAAGAVRDLLRAGAPGDVLVFLPGAHEIRRTVEACRVVAARLGEPVHVAALHGEMPPDEQDEALRARPERRVIVATNVAQTSITVEGVRHVIDAGLARVHRFDPSRGVNTLRIEPISRAAADQRAGRAGRTAPGTCRRLWTRRQQDERAAHDIPEIRRLDLAEPLLLLAELGLDPVGDLPMLEAPEPARRDRAIALLHHLGALDVVRRITPAGRQMASLPAHPRVARFLLAAAAQGELARACLWAALIGERDILDRRQVKRFQRPGGDGEASDFEPIEQAFEAARVAHFDLAACREMGVHAGACREVDLAARHLRQACREAGIVERRGADDHDLARALLAAYPDQLAALPPGSPRGYQLAGDVVAVLEDTSVVRGAPLLVAVELRDATAGRTRGMTLGLATRVEPDWLAELWPDRMTTTTATRWNTEARAVERHEQRCFDGLPVDVVVRPEADLDRAAQMLAERWSAGEVALPSWDERVEHWITRTRCVADWFPERSLSRYDAEDVQVIRLELCSGAQRWNQVRDRDALTAVKQALSWENQQFVERMAPERIELPRGWKMKVEYAPGQPPRGRGKIQDFYGLMQTPRVAGGRVPVLLEILAPNFRPVQVTDDLPGFWERLYPELKQELRRRYPRHEWR